MTANTTDPPQLNYVTVSIDFTVDGAKIHGELPVPATVCTVRDILPVLRSVTDSITAVVEQKAAAEGQPVTCKKGCGACCRQLVPISLEEAADLRDLIESMEPEQQIKIRSRFETARIRLAQGGILGKLQSPVMYVDDALRPLGVEYFHLGIPCPFLEDESCSIHEDRPLSCREYLVTSDASHCSNPTADNIKLLRMPAKISNIITRIGVQPNSRFTRWKPLILADLTNEEESEMRAELTGPELLRTVFERMADKPVAPASPLITGATRSGNE